MAGEFLPISEVVRVLRAELATAMAEGSGQAIQFELGTVEFEANVVVTSEGAGKTDLSFKILGWGVGGELGAKISDHRVQKLKIVLTPVDQAGRKVSISSKK